VSGSHEDPYSIAVLPGDGIGVEVMAAALAVLQAVEGACGRASTPSPTRPARSTTWTPAQHCPSATLDACRAADAILFGAMGLPHVRGADGTEIIPQLDLRFALDLYAGVRPVRTWPGLPVPLADPRGPEIDLVLVREKHRRPVLCPRPRRRRGRRGLRHDEDHARRHGPRLRLRAAAGAPAQGPGPARPGHQRRQGQRVRRRWPSGADLHRARAAFPDITIEHAYVDAMALNLVIKPWQYDVLVTENMFGDILSDLIAALVGGMGMAPSADIGDRTACSSPRTAPRPTSPARASPTRRPWCCRWP
jgi:3-isopropylmalate dehydrogenase